MQRLTKAVWRLSPPGDVFDDTVLINIFPESSPGARRALVHRALKSGEVLQIRRGLYCLSSEYRKSSPLNLLAIAEMIYWPSYVSFEMALSFHGLIPEHVTVITCATSRRSQDFETPVGAFAFIHVPCRMLYAGVNWVKESEKHRFQMASPLRAIADIIYTRKEVTWKKEGASFLIESLRIEPDELKKIDRSQAQEIMTSFTNKRVIEYIGHLTTWGK